MSITVTKTAKPSPNLAPFGGVDNLRKMGYSGPVNIQGIPTGSQFGMGGMAATGGQNQSASYAAPSGNVSPGGPTGQAPNPNPVSIQSGSVQDRSSQADFQAGLERLWANDPASLQVALRDNPGAFGATTQNNAAGHTGFSGSDGVGMDDYDSYINKYFSHAMRTMSPQIDQLNDRFDQRMIDQGFDPGSEGYGKAFDNMSRDRNDLINAAAFNAMGFGANRLDRDRNFDLTELSTMDTMNRAWNDIGYRDATFNTSREDQRFNQMLSMFGMTPVGSSTPANMGGAFNNQFLANAGALNAQNQMWNTVGQGVQDVVGGIDWGSIFGGQSNSTAIDNMLKGWGAA
jgi:hypothetical protein